MKKMIKQLLLAIMVSIVFLAPSSFVTAQGTTTSTNNSIFENLGSAASKAFGAPASGKASTTPGQVIGQVIKVILGFVGTIVFIIFLYGGFMWLTARGNDDQVKTAKSYLTNGVIGTVIVILAYSLTYFLTDIVFKATG